MKPEGQRTTTTSAVANSIKKRIEIGTTTIETRIMTSTNEKIEREVQSAIINIHVQIRVIHHQVEVDQGEDPGVDPAREDIDPAQVLDRDLVLTRRISMKRIKRRIKKIVQVKQLNDWLIGSSNKEDENESSCTLLISNLESSITYECVIKSLN